MDALVMRELYTQYKTAPTEEEKEKGTQGISGQAWCAGQLPMVISLEE